MGYKKKKTGSNRVEKRRVNSAGVIEVYYVDVPVYEMVWEPESGSQSYGTDTSYDTSGGYGSYE